MARLLERRSSRQAIRKSRSNLSIGIAVVAVLLGVELCNAQTSPGDTACAAREITLAMFVEAHGTGPELSIRDIGRQRRCAHERSAACDNGPIACARNLRSPYWRVGRKLEDLKIMPTAEQEPHNPSDGESIVASIWWSQSRTCRRGWI